MLRRVIGPGEVTYCGTAEYLSYTIAVLCVWKVTHRWRYSHRFP